MPISLVIISSVARPSRMAGFDGVPVSGTNPLSAARVARRFAWPLRDREVFRRADGRADYFLQPLAAEGSYRVIGVAVLSVRAVADFCPDPSDAPFGLAGLTFNRPSR